MKKIFTLALVLALLCSLLTGTVLAAGYSDVSENAWYQAAVADVTARASWWAPARASSPRTWRWTGP